jgi:uncharacterized repeat protein (TIGR01451 family)
MRTLTSIIILIILPAVRAVAAPDIEVQKSTNNQFPGGNEPVEFTVQVSNVGDELAADVVIIDQLPAEMTIPAGTAAFPSVGSYDPASGEWTIGDMDAGQSVVLVVPAIVIEAQPPLCIVNTATSQFADSFDNANDEARAAIHQAGVERCVDVDVAIGITARPQFYVFPTCDSEERYRGDVEVTNMGPDAARNVVVALSQNPAVGPNLRFDDVDCTNTPAAVCNIAEIASGETVTIDATSDLFRSYDSFEQTIAVSVSTSDADYDLSNNNPSSSLTGVAFSNCDPIDLGIPGIAVGPACFVATAAYGTPMHPHLDSLRDFRDRYLMTNEPGRALVQFYYRHSPPIADFIADRSSLRATVRFVLAPIVFAIENPGLAALMLLGIAGSIWGWSRRRNHRLLVR